MPFSVLLVIPLGVFGSVLAASLRGLESDVYFQVALLTTIGLSSKNAILIVEFAEATYCAVEVASLDGSRGCKTEIKTYFNDLIGIYSGCFTSGTFGMTGAGANSRISIGTGIIGGTLNS